MTTGCASQSTKRIVAFAVALLSFIAAGCSQTSTEQASLQSAPQIDSQAPAALEADEPQTNADTALAVQEQDTASPESGDGSAANSAQPDVGPEAAGDERGSRIGADDPESDLVPPTPPTPTSVPTTAPVPTPQPAPDAVDTDNASAEAESDDPQQPAPAATTTPAPTATLVPLASQGSETVFVAPAPTGPVPSDEIVVQGPVVDESQSPSISALGAAACAIAESAIDFLDRGDSVGAASALFTSSEIAAQSPEPEISALTTQLASAGTDEDAAIAAIIAMLNACAQHGYQV